MRRQIVLILVLFYCTASIAQNWYKSITPHFRDANCVQILNANDIIVGGGHLTNDNIQSVYRSYDNGLSWNVIQDVPLTANMINTMLFSDSMNGIAGCMAGEIIKTTNAGSSWVSSYIPLNRDIKKIIQYSSQIIIVGGNSSSLGNHQTVFSSLDNGVNWIQKRDTSLPSLNDISYTGSTLFAVGDSGYMLKSINAGDTWQKQILPIERDYKQIIFTSATNGFIVGGYDSTYSTILKTIDGGATWTIAVNDTGAILNDIAFLTPSLGYAVGLNSKIYSTINGGATWSLSQIPQLTDKLNLTAIDFVNSNFGVITSANGYVYIYSLATKPQVYTVDAEIVDSTKAIFKAACNTFGFSGNLSFVFDNSLSFPNGNETFAQAVKSDSIIIVSSNIIQGLMPNTLYYLYSKLSTVGGNIIGDTIRFYTGTPYAKFATLDAINATSTSVKLKAEVDKLNSSTTLFFEYGVSPSSFLTVNANPSQVTDTFFHAISASINNLIPQTFYFYRLRGIDANGINLYGAIKTFFTGSREIPNWDFQNWHNDTVALPYDWNVAAHNIAQGNNNGSATIIVQGQNILINGEIGEDEGNNSGPNFYGGHLFPHRPDSVFVSIKYDIVSGDTAYLLVYMYKADTVIANPFYPLAINSSNNTFETIALPIDYFQATTADSIVIGFVSFNPFDETPNDSLKYNYVEIDSIYFVENNNYFSLANFGFHNWYNYTYKQLDDWNYLPLFSINNNTNPYLMVEQDSFRNPLDFCAIVQNIPTIGNHFRRGEISSNPSFFKDRGPAFPISYKHQFLNGYYKFFPQNGDTMEIQLTMYQNGQQVGFASFVQSDTIDVFSPLNIPIYYNGGNVNPDSASIKISAAKRQVNGHSVVYIDKLNFDGLIEDLDTTTTAIIEQSYSIDNISIYPNPNNGKFTVNLPTNMSDVKLNIVDINGKIYFSEIEKPDSAANYSFSLSAGCYFVLINHKNGFLCKKIIVF